MSVSNQLAWSNDGEGFWNPQVVSQDVLITHISASMTGVSQDGFVDFCVNQSRDANPSYAAFIGGFSELFCWNAYFKASAGNANIDIDLSKTPIYVPVGTSLMCGGHTGVTIDQQKAATQSCTITYGPYSQGMPRYRTLRIPYFDQGVTPTQPYVDSYYIASDANHPLHIVGVVPYTAFDTSLKNCIQWIHEGGAIAQETCFEQTASNSINYVSLGLQPLDWSIPYPDLVGATCISGDSLYGCDDELIVEMPADLPAGPNSIFTNTGNIPISFLPQYCQARQNFATENLVYIFCSDGNGGATCDTQTAINDCIGLFP